ncbi:MAG: hypothetical protein E4G77_01350 [Nitrosopumilus sp.]|nr:MAG: hypothetical protein E4G77_01350 [Nitrosopumilus sp.]
MENAIVILQHEYSASVGWQRQRGQIPLGCKLLRINIPILTIFQYHSLTANNHKIIGINLFKIIETLYRNKGNSMYLNELCQVIRREYNDVKVDVMYLSSLGYAQSDFIEGTVNQRVALLTPKAARIMDGATPPKNYDEFVQMSANPKKDSGEPANLDKKSRFKRALGLCR